MRMITLFVLLVAVSSGVAADKKLTDELKLSADEEAVVEAANAERKQAGLGPLKPSQPLFKAARDHAANMAQQDRLAHDLDGKSAADRVTAAGYKFARTGENIGWKYRTPKEAVAGWMGSDGHRANILSTGFTDVGVAVAKNANGESYWVMVFGSPLPK